jgi:N-acetylneuraminic acid mutarotase
MKKAPKLLVLAFFTTWMIIFVGCKKDAEIPTLTTTEVSDITPTSATTGGSVNFSGGAEVSARGVCWGTSHNPTIDFAKTFDGTGSGTFASVIAGLIPNTTYYVRAYAINKAGTSYGDEIFFISPGLVTTTAIVSYSSTSAVVTGNVFYGQTEYKLIGSGVCWSTSLIPTTRDNKTMNETFSGIFTSNLTGLDKGTTYYVRAYAAYDNDTVIYGNELSFTTSFQPQTGTQKTDFPGGARYGAAGFSIGNKIYMGLGCNNGNFPVRDFWEWDQASNTWTKKADSPTNLTGEAVGFSIGSKGYIGFGNDLNDGVTNDFWEYDPSTNSWTQKTSVPFNVARASAVGFSIGTKGYIGTGYVNDGFSSSYLRDFWEWDQATDVWTQKADFPGNARAGAVGFSIGIKGYIGTGGNGDSYLKDFWEWDQATDAWMQKADLPGNGRAGAVGFSIGNKGYIGTGINENLSKDFWEWDQMNNVWTQKNSFAGNARSSAVGVSIGNKGYIATGFGGNPQNYLQDLWEYDPALK